MKRVPPPPRPWTELTPAEAEGLDLTKRLDITAPYNQRHERCAWPWTAQVADPARGHFACPHCGEEVVAGEQHPMRVLLDAAYLERYGAGSAHLRAPWLTTLKGWHHEPSLYREVYARALSAVIAASVIYVGAAVLGYVQRGPLFAVLNTAAVLLTLVWAFYAFQAVRYRAYVAPHLRADAPRFIPHPTAEQLRGYYIFQRLHWYSPGLTYFLIRWIVSWFT